MANLSPITFIKLFIIFNTSSDFFFQSEACTNYSFHAYFFFFFFLYVLIVVYTQRVYLLEVKLELRFTCFSLKTNYYFVIESIHAFYFINNVVAYKTLLI